MQHFAFILMPSYSAMAFFSALEPLRIANRLARRQLYNWTIHAPNGDFAMASNGMELRAESSLPPLPDGLVVCAAFDPLEHASPALLGQIRRYWRAGGRVGAIDTGAFILAEAGILGQEAITLHWEAADEFRRRYPRIPVSVELYERHGRLFTCAGGTAAMDMMLDEIAGSHGIALANAVSDQLIHERIRPPSAPQRGSQADRTGATNPLVQRLVTRMERGIARGESLAAILAAEDVSRRQAERLFEAQIGKPPGTFYRELRIRHAVELMRNARLPVHEAALAAGFSSQPVFSRACKQAFARSPRELLSEAALPWSD
jgi:AraC family carnitine catabolism transcriptional activator